MKAPVRAVARDGLAGGLGLAGVAVLPAETLAARLVAGTPEVLLVDDALLQALPPALRRRLVRGPFPIVLSLPDPRATLGRPRATDEILELLRRAVGYRVRLR